MITTVILALRLHKHNLSLHLLSLEFNWVHYIRKQREILRFLFSIIRCLIYGLFVFVLLKKSVMFCILLSDAELREAIRFYITLIHRSLHIRCVRWRWRRRRTSNATYSSSSSAPNRFNLANDAGGREILTQSLRSILLDDNIFWFSIYLATPFLRFNCISVRPWTEVNNFLRTVVIPPFNTLTCSTLRNCSSSISSNTCSDSNSCQLTSCHSCSFNFHL